MLGAILGDIIGSLYEFDNLRSKDFVLLDIKNNFMTDDSFMTIAIAKAILDCQDNFDVLGQKAIEAMRYIGNAYEGGYGGLFRAWLKSTNPKPYHSFGNGSAMRVSPCGLYYNNASDIIRCTKEVTKVTHNHPDSILAALAVSMSIYYLKKGMTKLELKKYLSKYYDLDDTVDYMRTYYTFTEDVKETMKPAILAFLESNSFEDAIRNAVSIGGDTDTIAAITGSLAEAYYGIPKELYLKLNDYVLYDELMDIIKAFESKAPFVFEKVNSKI
jgi:type I restriction enzyme M protein